MITDYLSRKSPTINTIVISSPLCVYPITDPSSSSDSYSITYMIESLPLDIKDHIKNLILEAKSKRIIRVLHDYLKQHYNHFLAIYPDPDQPWKTPFGYLIGLCSITFTCGIYSMSIIYAFILNQDFTSSFSLTIINILKISSLKS